MINSWLSLSMLAIESQQVIGLRLLKHAAGGPKAQAEANRMVSEKIAAASHATGRLMSGASADSIVTSYRKKVRANSRRLLKG
jgi:hypothetical protein